MLHSTAILRKNPVIYKQGQGMFTHQLKRLLQKKSIHKTVWDPLPMYNPRKLAHSNKVIDHYTYEEKYDPAWGERAYLVPDQQFGKVPVPREFKDAYWWRDLQARRVQCPIEWVNYKMYTKKNRDKTDFQDLSFRKKFRYSVDDVIEHAKEQRN